MNKELHKKRNFLLSIFIFFLLLLANFVTAHQHLVCSSTVDKLTSSYAFLSNKPVENANLAKKVCNSFYGNLLSMKDNSSVAYLSQKFFTKDTIYVYGQYIDALRTRYGYSTTPQLSDADVEEQNTPNGFTLYTRPIGTYNRQVTFCKLPIPSSSKYSKWEIQVDGYTCQLGWVEDLIAYHGSETSPFNQKLYHYHTVDSSSIVSTTPMGGYSSDATRSPLYVPNFRFYSGARSDYGEEEWRWPEGSIALINAPGRISPQHICEHVKIIFKENTFQSVPNFCDNAPGIFICEIQPLTFSIEEIECRDTALLLVWDVADDEFYLDYSLVVEVEFDGFFYAALLRSKEMRLVNLLPATVYEIKVYLKSDVCPTFNLPMTITATTGNGRPSPVTKAWVVQLTNSSSSECIIEWNHDIYNDRITKYQITFNETIIIRTVVVQSSEPRFSNPVLHHRESFAGFEPNQVFVLKIHSFTCFGNSSATEVEGYCVTPTPITSIETSTSIVVLSKVDKPKLPYYPIPSINPAENSNDLEIFAEDNPDEPVKDNSMIIIISCVLGLIFLIILCICGIVCLKRCRKTKQSEDGPVNDTTLELWQEEYVEVVTHCKEQSQVFEETADPVEIVETPSPEDEGHLDQTAT